MPAARAADRRPAATWRMHSGQHAAFASSARTRVVVAGRRWGKSELAVMWQLARARDDALMRRARVHWWVSPTYSLTRPIWRKFQKLGPAGWITGSRGTEGDPDWLELGPVRIEFKSAEHPERLVAEGLSSVVIDECGVIRESVWTESIMPTLIDHSAPAMLVGTPKGRNWFHRMWSRGKDPLDPEVESFGGPSVENPFVNADEVRRLAAELPERLHRQEILAEFLDDEGAVFRGVRACVTGMSSERTVAIGVDLGRKVDFTVIVGLDATGRVTKFDRFNQISWPLQKQRIAAAAKAAPRAKILMDSSGPGDSPTQDLQAAGLEVDGFVFSERSKQQLVEALAIAIEQREVGLPDEPVLVNELEAYEFTVGRTGHVRYSAPEGAHDDCVMALGLAHWARTRMSRAPGDIGITF